MSTTLRFGKPALEWLEGLPLANGISAAMVWGEPHRTVLSLNHVDFWRDEVDEEVPDYSELTAEARRLMLEGRVEEANRFIDERFVPTGLPCNKRACQDLEGRTNAFCPIGNLAIEIDGADEVTGYERTLDLKEGIVRVEFATPAGKVSQEVFIPLEHDVVVVQVRADHAPRWRMHFDRKPQELYEWHSESEDGGLVVRGEYAEGVRSALVVRPAGTEAVGESAGEWNESFPQDSGLVLVIAVESGKGDDLVERCRERIARAERDGFEEMLRRHIEEHSAMFGRVELHLEGGSDEGVFTDELVRRAIEGEYDNRLAEQVFQMGRYLLMSCNRAGRHPANLQGIWNDNPIPPWGADYHLDMNVQMNQWLANPTNLDECNLALFAQMDRLVPRARSIARGIAGCEGILFDLIAGGDGMNWNCFCFWTGAAAWIAQHYWTHWEYTLDREFLAGRAYPFLREVGLFYRDFLVKDADGFYVAPPSFSPENRPPGHRHCVHCTMDTALVHEVMRHLLEAGETLGVDSDLWPVWRELHDNVLPYPVSEEGALKEYPHGFSERQDHRHYSHLYPVFPGDEFSPEQTPELWSAAREAVRLREEPGRAHNFGWSYPYLALMYARFGEGDNALENLHCLARAVTVDNLLTCGCDWKGLGLTVQWKFNVGRLFQIEAGLGATAAIAQMLLQSHGGVIRLLPALPSKWGAGHVRGRKARGGFVVDIEWRDRRLVEAKITSLKGGTCRVKVAGEERCAGFEAEAGECVRLAPEGWRM